MNLDQFFTSDPNILGGQTVLKGTRIPLATILASLAEGESFEELVKAFPYLSAEHLNAVVALKSIED